MTRSTLFILLASLVLAVGAFFAFSNELQENELDNLEIPFEVQPINM